MDNGLLLKTSEQGFARSDGSTFKSVCRNNPCDRLAVARHDVAPPFADTAQKARELAVRIGRRNGFFHDSHHSSDIYYYIAI